MNNTLCPPRPLFARKFADRAMTVFSALATAFAVGAILWIIATILVHGASALGWDFLVNPSKPYGEPDAGIGNALLGTLLITGGAALLAVPPGLAAGIWLSEYGRVSRLAAGLRFSLNVLMGLPSVVVGLFVYVILVVPSGHFSGFAGSVALAILMFPVVARTTEDMLAMVADTLRESGLALGATRRVTTLGIVCRQARSGLVTGVLLAVARVSGETAPLLFTALFVDSWPTTYFTGPTPSAPVLITNYAMDSPFESMHRAGWGAALVVALVVLAINIGARAAFREKKANKE